MSEQNPNPEVFPPGTTKYFLKEILSNKVTVRLPVRGGGERLVVVPFVDLGDDVGGLEISEPEQISALRRLVASRRGGVSEVNKEEYEKAKKVAIVQEQRRDSLKPKSLLNQPYRIDNLNADAAAKKVDPGLKFPDPSIPEELAASDSKPPEPAPSVPELRTPKPRRRSAAKPEASIQSEAPLALTGDTVTV